MERKDERGEIDLQVQPAPHKPPSTFAGDWRGSGLPFRSGLQGLRLRFAYSDSSTDVLLSKELAFTTPFLSKDRGTHDVAWFLFIQTLLSQQQLVAITPAHQLRTKRSSFCKRRTCASPGKHDLTNHT